jgi:hypothetical protein
VDGNALFAVLAVAGVAAIAFLMRGRGDERVAMPRADDGAGVPAPGDGDDLADAEDDAAAPLVIESDGHVWLPVGSGLRRLPLASEEDDPALVAAGYVSRDAFERRRAHARARGDAQGLTGEPLAPGDFTAARVVRGAPGIDPWRLEALGPDGEYVTFAFEVEDAARTALGLLEERGIVRRPLDDDGRPIPASPGDFAEARRRAEETMAALEIPDPPDEPERR